MLKSVSILFAIALVQANDDQVSRLHRNGEFNRYYLYNREVFGSKMSFDTPASDLLIGGVTTVVIVHGYRASYLSPPNPKIREKLLQSEDLNVISVDWALFAGSDYETAQRNIISVSEYLATFLRNQEIDPRTLHLVGFNLGAHIVGLAGRRLGGVARITGLDPSASTIKLSVTDANYVEVIHTDAGGCNDTMSTGAASNGIGEKLGHADFYPNGGKCQPGCANNACNHDRAWDLFAASIKDNTFIANCCNTLSEKDLNTCMGRAIDMGNNSLVKLPCSTGIYRVDTGNSYPY